MSRAMIATVAALALLGVASAGYADDAYSMAPPVDGGSAAYSSSASNVFGWQEVPAEQQVPIERAVFDHGGYQLYDSVGETIVVPFSNNNLYVMKFGVSQTGSMYFVNSGDAPILYLPENGYLQNATCSGGRWYPFTERWHPATPVYLGCAPSWSAYTSIGWYPGMYCHGGYWRQFEFWHIYAGVRAVHCFWRPSV